MVNGLRRYVAAFDLHLGYERKHGRKVPLHDPKAWDVVLQFTQDFKPHHFIFGGDILDCGPISHHNKGKPGNTDGLRLLSDAQECQREVIQPVESIVGRNGDLTFLWGNHESWILDRLDEDPALEGVLDLKTLLALDKWRIPDFCHGFSLGKLHFIHGHEVRGGEHVAKAAVTNYERSVRFGHHHTYQTYTKTSAIDQKLGKTGVAVPCLCTKDPKYGEGKPNRWVQGFAFGYVAKNGDFTDYVGVIVDGRFAWNGKLYRG